MSKDIIVPHPWPGAAPEITLRDWFAGQVIAGLSAAANLNETSVQTLATFAYWQADAMLAEREKEANK